MAIEYITDINDINKTKVLLLIEASLQAYNAFSKKTPAQCQVQNITPPIGYDFVDSWTGIDAIFSHDKTVECYGVIFRSQSAPYTYIFAFRGTSSLLDIIDDLGFETTAFSPHDSSNTSVPSTVSVESGFFNVYSESSSDTPAMQKQLFSLIDRYNASDKPIDQLFITGHSLGAAISELFTLDVALSRPEVSASNFNYACPRVGNKAFVKFYQQQAAQQNIETRTLRIQNTYDKVPCGPLESMGYQHLSYAYLIAFYEQSRSGIEEMNLLARHSSLNYQAVLTCAVTSRYGVCITDKLEVPGNGYAVTSEQPDQSTICSFW
jgi:hypothetical protein